MALLPQQIVTAMPGDSEAVLLDQWGRIHPLATSSEVGRSRVPCGIAIFHASVSRRHASIARTHGAWRVVDAGSTNGTRVNTVRVVDAALAHGDLIRFGAVGFYLLFDIGRIAWCPEPTVPTSVQPEATARTTRARQR